MTFFPENFIFPGFPGFPDPVGTLPKVTNFGSQNFGKQIWFCTRPLTSSLTEAEPQTNPEKARRKNSYRKEYKESNLE